MDGESVARAGSKGYTGEKVCRAGRGREKSGAQVRRIGPVWGLTVSKILVEEVTDPLGLLGTCFQHKWRLGTDTNID